MSPYISIVWGLKGLRGANCFIWSGYVYYACMMCRCADGYVLYWKHACITDLPRFMMHEYSGEEFHIKCLYLDYYYCAILFTCKRVFCPLNSSRSVHLCEPNYTLIDCQADLIFSNKFWSLTYLFPGDELEWKDLHVSCWPGIQEPHLKVRGSTLCRPL